MSLPVPPVRADGACAVCGQPRKLAGLAPLYRTSAEADPFCSAACARAWHGCALPERERDRERG